MAAWPVGVPASGLQFITGVLPPHEAQVKTMRITAAASQE